MVLSFEQLYVEYFYVFWLTTFWFCFWDPFHYGHDVVYWMVNSQAILGENYKILEAERLCSDFSRFSLELLIGCFECHLLLVRQGSSESCWAHNFL